jgi:hypothetical protein
VNADYASWISDAVRMRPAFGNPGVDSMHPVTRKIHLTAARSAGTLATRLTGAADDRFRGLGWTGLRRVERAAIDSVGAAPYTAGTD